jgi:hypothetical protein
VLRDRVWDQLHGFTLPAGRELAAALKACKKKPKAKRAACQRTARKRYGAVRKKGGRKK